MKSKPSGETHLLASLAFLFALLLPTFSIAGFAEDYGTLPNVSASEISPNGDILAQLQSKDGVKAIAFYDLGGGLQPIGVKLGDVKARGMRWVGENHVIVLVSANISLGDGFGKKKPYEFWRYIAVDHRTGKFAYLFGKNPRLNYWTNPGFVVSNMGDEPNTILMGHYSRKGNYSLYTVRLDTGKEKLIHQGHGNTTGWIVDHNGKPILRIDYNWKDEQRRFFTPDETGYTLASEIIEKKADNISLRIFSATTEPDKFFALTTQTGHRELSIYDIREGKISSSVFSVPNRDLDESAFVDPHTGKLVGVFYQDELPRVQFIDEELSRIQKSLQKTLPDASPIISSWSSDRKKFMVRVLYTDHPIQYFLYDSDNRNFSMISPSYDNLDGSSIATKSHWNYKTSDNLEIPGFLTTPNGQSTSQLPLIVLPHGGPFAQETGGFDWWSFFYAANGYLVYQPNFRGSTGYGNAFEKEGYAEWGGKMQDDITEGVQKLISEGRVDASRICIVGASYGGYAALVGATKTPDLYKCAVSVAGVSNLPAMIAYQTDRGRIPEDAWDLRIGQRVNESYDLKLLSPFYQVKKVGPPILLMHGDDDIVVPIGQSRMMEDALKQTKIIGSHEAQAEPKCFNGP